MTPGEITAIASWVRRGNGLLVESDNFIGTLTFQDLLTELAAGITLDEVGATGGGTSDTVPHPTTSEVTSLLFPFPSAVH